MQQSATLLVTNPLDERLKGRELSEGNVCTLGTLNERLKKSEVVSMAGSKGDFLLILEED